MSLSPDELKKELRARMRGLRRGQDPALARQRARAAQQALLDWDVWQHVSWILLQHWDMHLMDAVSVTVMVCSSRRSETAIR